MNSTDTPDLLEGVVLQLPAPLPLAIIDHRILPGGSRSAEVGVEWQ
jgi:hypothetical protein